MENNHKRNDENSDNSLLSILFLKIINSDSSNNIKSKQQNSILFSIMQFMDFKDIFNLKILCKTISYQISETTIKHYIKKVGMNNEELRKSFINYWLKFSNYYR